MRENDRVLESEQGVFAGQRLGVGDVQPRIGDLSLGDFWGIGNKIPFDYEFGNGISLVLINSTKGQDIFNACHSQMFYEKRSFEEAVAGGPNICHSPKLPAERTRLLKDLQVIPFEKVIFKYLKDKKPDSNIIKRAIRKMIGINRYQ